MLVFRPCVARKLGRKYCFYPCCTSGCQTTENAARLHLHPELYREIVACEEEDEAKLMRLSAFQTYLRLGFHPSGARFYMGMFNAAARESNWAAMGEAFIPLQGAGAASGNVR